ncbi:MAG: hypothetical protein JNK79_10870 [Chitinophagaceae bacterium]|nr:hypothetical protein [Chitinophagaceae bacterium]
MAIQLNAQLPEDAIRMSWSVPSGTARNQAIGGAAGSLGGDITSTFVNPAGIGFYKTSEFVFSPMESFFGGKSQFRGTSDRADKEYQFNLGATGLVVGSSNPNSKWNSKAFSIAINRAANFNNEIFYQGQNDFSSFSESFAEEFANSGLPINTELPTAPLSFGTKLANYAYLIDTLTIDGTTQVVGLPERDALLNGTDFLLRQEKSISTSGGITEIAIGYAGNMNDKLFIGGSLGIPIVKYERKTILSEYDESGNNDNNFNYARYIENYEATGGGFNLKFGMIVKPTSSVRAGFAIHSPTIYSIRESTTGSIEADLEGYLRDGRYSFADEDSIYTQFDYNVPRFRYDYFSPWRFLVSGSYVFSGVEDVSQQRGFITADIEYVTHRSSRFRSGDDLSDDDEYYDAVNEAVKSSYKGAFNFRVGGEMKFNTFMTRLGFNYYGAPYNDSQLKARKMNISGGLGYRNKGIFVDATYVLGVNRDVDFPYRLGDRANTFAELKDNNSSVLLTVGIKF